MATEGDTVRVIAGRYRLQRRLGRGGMGVVWRATDELLGRQVAVKELLQEPAVQEPAQGAALSAEDARRQRDRTLREASAVAQLRHPHIIVVHDVVEQDDRPYIVMELIDGGSLADRIAAHGPVDARQAARIGVALLGALRTAHQAGVLHRDIKPANVLVESATDRVVLTDFGIAQVAGATTLTETGSFVGSPEYTAPERMSGTRTGPESDLWSLGALLCTALSGESPFRRDSLGGILHAVVVDEIRTPAQAEPLLPVVRGLLERDPERRLGAAEAERLLRSYLDTGRTPHPASSPYSPTALDTPAPPPPSPPLSAPQPPGSAAAPRYSTRGVLVTALLVAAMAGAGVSAAALLMQQDGNGGGGRTGGTGTPVRSSASVSASVSAPGTGAGPGPGSSSVPSVSQSPVTPAATVSVNRSPAPPSRTAPSGYRPVRDPAGFSLAVPEGFTRQPQGVRIFYMSPGETFRLGIKIAAPEDGGPVAVMNRADAAGPDTNPGYHDGRVTATTHDGHPAALWEFSWDGFSTAEGPRHTYDLCWEEAGRLYDVWVSAPVGKVREAREYFDVALDTFRRT